MKRQLASTAMLLEQETGQGDVKEQGDPRSKMQNWLASLMRRRGRADFRRKQEEKEQVERFKWRKPVQMGQKEEKQEVESRRMRFEEVVAEVVRVEQAVEVFPDDFEDDPEPKEDPSMTNTSIFNLSSFHCSFTSLDSSYQQFKSSLKHKLRSKPSASSTKLEEESYHSFETVDANLDLMLTRNFGTAWLCSPRRGA